MFLAAYAEGSSGSRAVFCDRPGYEGIRTHSFRKWYATEIYKNSGFDIALVQRLLQHSSTAAGDSVITLEVSRLARSTQQLCEIIDLVREKHLRLVIIGSITLDCRDGQPDPMSEAFLQMAGVFSQLELAMIRARVRSGMENARAKGRRIGRPQLAKEDIPAAFLRHYPAYKAGNLNVSELARVCDLSRTTAYKYIGLLEGKFILQEQLHHLPL